MKKVITYGTFDLFHEGHYRLLERAKALGDHLIVGVTTEDYDQTRGKLNVVDDRCQHITAKQRRQRTAQHAEYHKEKAELKLRLY